MALKSDKEKQPTKKTSPKATDDSSKKASSKSKKKEDENEEEEDEDIDTPKASKKAVKGSSKPAAEDDDESEDEVDEVEDDWNKVEEDDDWDPDIDEFNRYNPGFDKEMASPNNSYPLRLPAEKLELFSTHKYQILNESIQLLLSSATSTSDVSINPAKFSSSREMN